jgi:hypothetical protein
MVDTISPPCAVCSAIERFSSGFSRGFYAIFRRVFGDFQAILGDFQRIFMRICIFTIKY